MNRLLSSLLLFCIAFIPRTGNAITPDEVVQIIKNKQNYPNYVLVAAHRGYWADYPENSQGAYEMAIELDVDIVEMDVRLTKDGQMVIFHDACLDRVTTGYGRLRDTNWSEVQQLYLVMPDGRRTYGKMLTLEQALDSLKGKAVVSIDIKETGSLFNSLFVKILKMLKTKGMLGQSIVKGKMPLAEIQSLVAQAGATLDDFIYTPIAFSNTRNLDQYIKDFVNSKKIYAFELVYKQSADPILQYVSLLNSNHIWIGQYSFWPETADGVFAEKIPLTDTDPITRDYKFQDRDPGNFLDDGRGDWDWLFSKGANYVITDRSELMLDYLTVKGLRSK